VNPLVDPAFAFMTLDWDAGSAWTARRRTPWPRSSAGAPTTRWRRATTPDADRHGIVTPDAGLMNPNHFLAVSIDYLYRNRDGWPATDRDRQDPGLVLDDRPGRRRPRPHAARGPRRLQVVRPGPARRLDRLRRRGRARRRVVPAAATERVWTTDKDGHTAVPARLGDPGPHRPTPSEHYGDLVARHGAPAYAASTSPAPARRRRCWAGSRPEQVGATSLAGEADHREADGGPGQRGRDRRAQGRHGLGGGSPPARPGPRTSTRSTRSRSGAPSTWLASRTRPGGWCRRALRA